MKIIKCLLFLILFQVSALAQSKGPYSLPKNFMLQFTEELYKQLGKENLGTKNKIAIFTIYIKMSKDSVHSISTKDSCPEYILNSFRKALNTTILNFNKYNLPIIEFSVPLIFMYKPNKNESLNESFTTDHINYLFEEIEFNDDNLKLMSRPVIYINPYKSKNSKFKKYNRE